MTVPPLWPDWDDLFAFSSAIPPCRPGHPEDLHTYAGKPRTFQHRRCTRCLHVRPPVLESITCHPTDRARLDATLPTARVFGEPLPDGALILESVGVQVGTIRLCIEGDNITATLGDPPPEPQKWIRMDPHSGRWSGESW